MRKGHRPNFKAQSGPKTFQSTFVFARHDACISCLSTDNIVGGDQHCEMYLG
jgi:hypothetical protein